MRKTSTDGLCLLISDFSVNDTVLGGKKSEINVVINTWILLVLIVEEQVIMHRWLSDPSIQKSGDNSKIKKS